MGLVGLHGPELRPNRDHKGVALFGFIGGYRLTKAKVVVFSPALIVSDWIAISYIGADGGIEFDSIDHTGLPLSRVGEEIFTSALTNGGDYLDLFYSQGAPPFLVGW